MSVDLEAIEARLAAATPGDWTVSEGDGYGVGTNVVAPRPDMGVGVNGAVAHDVFHMPDADLIAHAPSDLAACVEEIRELRLALRKIADQHRPDTTFVLDYRCYNDDCENPEHEDECPEMAVDTCGWCRAIKEEVDDEAPFKDEDRYPCPTAKLALDALGETDA